MPTLKQKLRVFTLGRLSLLLFPFTATILLGSDAAAPQKLSFNKDIRPILSDYCFTCHGQDEGSRKGKLRLDVREAALKGGKSGMPAIVPGKPEESELLTRINAHDEDEKMPPAKTGKILSSREIQVLTDWIKSGAAYEAHWAFIPPARPELPRDTENHPIDSLVSERLKAEGLKLSASADRATLLRRLSLDLIGLPPTPVELDQFINDTSPNAWEKQIDRLLASPHFGEKWARHWLDAARYADSDGYEKDLPRNQWPWRDWVIQAINKDLPYDRFITEQLAGDLLPNATQDQRIATGYLRNGMVNEEGAIIAEQFRLEGMFDRMDAIGRGILGVTLQCAQCHTHKYDPISHEEYFKLFALLDNTYEATSWIYTPEQQREIALIHESIAKLETEIKHTMPDWKERLAKWAKTTAAEKQDWTALDFSEYEWVGGLSHPQKLDDLSILTLGFRPTVGELYVVATNIHSISNWTGIRLETLTHGDLPFRGPGRSYKGTFAISELMVEAAPQDGTNWTRITLTNATASFAEATRSLEEMFRKGTNDNRVIGPASFLIDGKDETAWGTDRGPGRRHQDMNWVAQFSPDTAWPTGAVQVKITFKYRHGGADDHGRKNNFLGRFRLAVTRNEAPKADPIPANLRKALAKPPEHWSQSEEAELFSFWWTTVPDLKDENQEIEKLWSKFPEGDSVLNLARRDADDERVTHLLERGNWQKPSQKVSPGVPAFLHPLPADAGKDRLALARWLSDRRSPTTARVFVNRVWQSLFGNGLVETAEDFGVRSSAPIHQDLLDWLAVEFMEPAFNAEGGTSAPWSLKHLLRVIASSKTYQQKSTCSPSDLEKDPQNKFLARGPRFRAEAEVIRDIALSVSGLLNQKIGGPSIFPPVPESLFSESFLRVDFWNTANGPDRYRRSLYTFRRRSMPDPALANFDAPNGDFACVRRSRSNTPLAALTSLNEPVFVEAAQALALRVLREGGAKDQERANYAFRLCTGRTAREQEVQEILSLLNSQHIRLSEGWILPRDIAFSNPDQVRELPAQTTPTQVAAWTIVSRVLLNLDETLNKN